MAQKSKPGFTPSAEQMAHWPDISGNAINGLGETERRAAPILWHDPARLAHGALQNWFWEQGRKEPALFAMRSRRQAVIDQPDAPVAVEVQTIDPRLAATKVKLRAFEAGADLVGITRIDPAWVFEGYDMPYSTAIILGCAMDHDQLQTAPALPAAVEVVDKYTKGWEVARPVSDWIRAQGWPAEPKGGPEAGPILLIPAAIAAGMGELGKHGSLINAEFGSSFRLSAIFTDMPLALDNPADIAAQDFCLNCQICVDACPPQAIAHDTQTVRGDDKWYVDFDKCMPYFAETYGCAICLAVCPWSAPGRAPLLSEKMLRRRARKETEAGE